MTSLEVVFKEMQKCVAHSGKLPDGYLEILKNLLEISFTEGRLNQLKEFNNNYE